MLRAMTALLGVLACSGCNVAGAGRSDEPEATRDRLERVVCSAQTRAEVQSALETAHMEYFFDDALRILTAKRTFNEEKLVSSAVVIEVHFNVDQSLSFCKVRVLHTGP
jgi:hypothetical protein